MLVESRTAFGLGHRAEVRSGDGGWACRGRQWRESFDKGREKGLRAPLVDDGGAAGGNRPTLERRPKAMAPGPKIATLVDRVVDNVVTSTAKLDRGGRKTTAVRAPDVPDGKGPVARGGVDDAGLDGRGLGIEKRDVRREPGERGGGIHPDPVRKMG